MSDNRLFLGDNLAILRDHVDDGSIDLAYLDPPFDSGRGFHAVPRARRSPSGAPASVAAFADSWRWDAAAEESLARLRESARSKKLAALLEALGRALGEGARLAYLVYVGTRLVEVHRTLAATGSAYVHCDASASHYLKLMLDVVFGEGRFVSEIVWRRTNAHSDVRRWSPVADSILFYAKGPRFTWNPAREGHSAEHVRSKYRGVEPDGRRYSLGDMASPTPRPNLRYAWRGFEPPPFGWRYSLETMERLHREGRIAYPDSKDKRPRRKRYLDEMRGTPLGSVWTDIDPVNSQATERVGWATQKPLRLLERIVRASSREGDRVLDPFAGSGTALVAASRLGRAWTGIDASPLAVELVRERLRSTLPELRFEVVAAAPPRSGRGARGVGRAGRGEVSSSRRR